MALPQTGLFQVTPDPASTVFLTPDSYTAYNTISYERGGVAIGDGSAGINGYNWVCRYDSATGNIYLKNMDTGVETLIITVLDIVLMSFAFDSNMRPVIVYKLLNDECYFYWYDTIAEDYTTTQLPVGSDYPLVCHDDKRRIGQSANYSDVLIFYLYNNKIYNLVQRQRYQTANIKATVTPGTVLIKVGMCDDLRLKIELSNGTFVSSP